MTVAELYDFMKESFHKIEKRLDELSDLNTRLTKLEFQTRILWISSGIIGLSTLSVILNSLYKLIIK